MYVWAETEKGPSSVHDFGHGVKAVKGFASGRRRLLRRACRLLQRVALGRLLSRVQLFTSAPNALLSFPPVMQTQSLADTITSVRLSGRHVQHVCCAQA